MSVIDLAQYKYTLQLDSLPFVSGMKDAEAQAETMKKKISGVGNFLKTSLTAGLAATGAIIAGTVAKSVDSADDLQKAMNSFQSATGIATENVDGFDQALKNIYAGNFGEDFNDIADAMATVTKNSRLLDPTSIEQMTTNAIALRDTFDYDIQESMRAVNMLMDQFGISGEEAFNLISQGAQSGLDKNGDLLDSINEYSVHFKQLGIDAEGMFNALANGTYTGTFSVDKLGDAVKEFGIRVKDESDSTNSAFNMLGLDAEETAKAFTQGGDTAKQAFEDVSKKLFEMENPLQQNQVGVALFGTMWEDLGTEGVKALTDIDGEFDRTYDSMNQIKDIKYNSVGEAFKGIGRQLETNLMLPIGEKILPLLNTFANWINQQLPNSIGKFKNVMSSISTFFQPVIDTINTLISSFKNADTQSNTSFGAIRTTITNILGTIQGIVQGFIDLFNVVWNKWGTDIVSFVQLHFKNVISVIANAFNFIKNLVDFFTAFFKGDWTACFDSIQKIVSSGWELIKSTFKIGIDFVTNILTAGLTLMGTIASNLMNLLWSGIKRIWDNINTWFKDTINNLLDWFGNLGESFFNLGANILNWVWDGLKSVWESIYSWVEEKVAWMIEKLTFWRKSQEEMEEERSSSKRKKKKADGSHKDGLDYVPWDGYTAILHKGERVLTAQQNAAYSSNYNSPITINMGDITVSGGNRIDANDIGRIVKNQLDESARELSSKFKLRAYQVAYN